MKINRFMAILLWLNKQKLQETGKARIYCRITINGIRTELSTGKTIHPDYWNTEAHSALSKCPNAIEINEDLESLKGDLRRIYNQLAATNKSVTSEMVKLAYTGKGQKKKTILELFTAFNELLTEKYQLKKIVRATWQKPQTLTAKLQRFLLKEYGTTDRALCDLNSSFGENG